MKDLDFLCKVEGLKVTFQVLSRVPANAVVSWNFGDGTDAYNQARVTHNNDQAKLTSRTIRMFDGHQIG